MISENDKNNLKKLGTAFQKQRIAKGLSFRELSNLTGVDYSQLSKIEKGQVNITFTTILQLANGLEVHLVELFKSGFD